MTLVDCHCHAGHGDGLSHPSESFADIGPYCRRAEVAGITHTVLFAALGTDYAAVNREVARIVAEGRVDSPVSCSSIR